MTRQQNIARGEKKEFKIMGVDKALKNMQYQSWFAKHFQAVVYGLFPLRDYFPVKDKNTLYEILGEKGELFEVKHLNKNDQTTKPSK